MSADGRPYGVTCNSFASVSLNPPLVLWSLGMFSQGLTIFQNASHLAVNVLDVSQQELALKFAKSSGEKFAGVEWTPGLGNAPVIAGSVAQFQCRAVNRYYGGDHIIFLRKVEPGAADRSYGIEVAKLAGLPNEVVVRAREVLAAGKHCWVEKPLALLL